MVTIKYNQFLVCGLVTLCCQRNTDSIANIVKKLQDLSHRVTATRLMITVNNDNFSNNMNVNYNNHFCGNNNNSNNNDNNCRDKEIENENMK